jgi:hypothetical protein
MRIKSHWSTFTTSFHAIKADLQRLLHDRLVGTAWSSSSTETGSPCLPRICPPSAKIKVSCFQHLAVARRKKKIPLRWPFAAFFFVAWECFDIAWAWFVIFNYLRVCPRKAHQKCLLRNTFSTISQWKMCFAYFSVYSWIMMTPRIWLRSFC